MGTDNIIKATFSMSLWVFTGRRELLDLHSFIVGSSIVLFFTVGLLDATSAIAAYPRRVVSALITSGYLREIKLDLPVIISGTFAHFLCSF